MRGVSENGVLFGSHVGSHNLILKFSPFQDITCAFTPVLSKSEGLDIPEVLRNVSYAIVYLSKVVKCSVVNY
jgi:hypothetical protein